jgi:hypothetical protein
VVSIAADEIQWKVSPGEQPRKKGAAASGKEKLSSEQPIIPLAEIKKTPVTNVAQPKDSKRNVTPVSQKVKTKQKDQSQDLLSENDPPINAATEVLRPLRAVAIQSPGTAELEGLQFAENTSRSIPAKSIDEVICPKTTVDVIPETHSGRNDQSQEVINGRQIIEELRDMREYIRSHHSLSARDIERILEAKLHQLMPTISSPAAESAASGTVDQLDDVAAPIESPSASHQQTNAVEVSSDARRDLTPFEGHRSPPPPSSSSNSPPSADKRAHKVYVPGLSPTRSESPDIISQLESLEVSEKLAPPLQPQRAIPTPPTRPLEIPKRAAKSDASVQVTSAVGSRPKQVTRKPMTLDDSIFARSAGPATSTPKATEPNAQSQITTRALSANHPNIPSRQGEKVQSTGVRTIGPAPYKPRVIGPAPSVYEPTTFRDLPGAHVRIVSAHQATMDTRTENRSFMNVATHGQSSGPASEQPAGRMFSMPDPATLMEPKVKTAASIPTSRPRRQ